MKRLRLINEREKRNISAKKLAATIGISKSMVSHIESGRYNPSWAVAQKLEKFFGIPASELLAECEDEVICKK